ncbi:MAG TPA: hypothetical protein VF284_00945 [Rhodanobacteraceae bacterium]
MTDITVKLNTNPPSGEAAVTCHPPQFNANSGNQEIKWKSEGSEDFTFTSLTGLSDHNPPFSGLTVSDDEITIDDNDQGPADYSYTIWVRADANGLPYSTIPTDPTATPTVPCIVNK